MRLWKKIVLCLLATVCLLSLPVQAAQTPAYSFTSIDGETVSSSTNAGKVTLIVYMHMSSAHEESGTLIRELAAADWIGNPGLCVIVVDFMGGTADTIRQFVTPYIGGNTDITFCADQGDNFFQLTSAAGLSGYSFSLPLSFVVGQDGEIKAHMMGDTSETSFRNLLHTYVEGIDPAPTTTLSIPGEEVYSQAFEVLRLINIQRRDNNLPALKMDAVLLDAAMLRAAECTVYYSHTRPNGTQCFTAVPSGGGSLGENIAVGQQSAEDVMEDWMDSQGHRANILNENFSSVGVGVFLHGGIYTWVQMFSSQESAGMTAPADAAVKTKVEVLDTHLALRAEPAQLMLKQNAAEAVSLVFTNQGFDPLEVRLDSADLTFRSSNPKVAKVDASGLVTAVSPGTAEITIELGGTNMRATTFVTVGEHNYQQWKYQAPTCAEPGMGEYVCTDCGDRIIKEIPKLTTHTWDSGAVTQKPTTEKEGVKTYTCTLCGKTKTQSIPKYPEPAPTVPATKAPTVPATNAPTVKPTAAPTMPATQPATVPTTAPTAVSTDPTAMPIPEPTEMPPEVFPTEPTEKTTEPMESSPESAPGTQPTQAETQQPTEPADPPGEDGDTKLIIGIIVAVVATLAAGAFLLLWKRKE